MNATFGLLRRGLAKLHRDEDGMEVLQVVLIVAIAALILAYFKGTLWAGVKTHVEDQLKGIGVTF